MWRSEQFSLISNRKVDVLTGFTMSQAAKPLFENQPEIKKYLTPVDVTDRYPVKLSTIYDWRARPRKYKCPPDLFHPFQRRPLWINREVLETWIEARPKAGGT